MTQSTKSNGHNKDLLFSNPVEVKDFVFDEDVARVFSDMINRSVPGYSTIISLIAVLAKRYCQEGSNVYDLGCSLGGASLAMAKTIDCANYKLFAIDNSVAMTKELSRVLSESPSESGHTTVVCDDILDSDIYGASVVVLNFTLQFIPVDQRSLLIEKIYKGMKKGGVLILSEKIKFPDEELNALFIEMYHSFKQRMGYSKLEISQKRTALENVLIPETIDDHKSRALQAGFKSIDVWFQCFNFASLVAFK